METYQSVEKLVDKILPDIVSIRHTIHQNPELALQEYDTAALIRKTLDSAGIRPLEPFLETDVVAILEGKEAGANVTLRADIDALPLQEKTGLPYQSKRDGLMHACGHDGHTATLIGSALVLSKLKDQFRGSVRFVFQPGEEVVAAGKDLVGKGALRDPEPDAVFALHAWSGIPEGSISSKPGVLLAAADFFKITVQGKGAHGSAPEASVDPILIAARIVEALQTIASRRVSALDSAVVSVCRICGGTNSNIIPSSVELEGTTRYLDPETGKKIPEYMEQIVKGVCDSMGASYEFSYTSTYIPTINNHDIVALGKRVTEDLLGASSWIELSSPSMAGEDFAYYIRDYPGAMFRLGMGKESATVHNPYFDFNDNALKNGILFLVSAALETLSLYKNNKTD
ncbi:MAG: amidohydrolase [Desulfobacterales bacterium]|nr:amidohydrolase [Desulfobacterales bacterium]